MATAAASAGGSILHGNHDNHHDHLSSHHHHDDHHHHQDGGRRRSSAWRADGGESARSRRRSLATAHTGGSMRMMGPGFVQSADQVGPPSSPDSKVEAKPRKRSLLFGGKKNKNPKQSATVAPENTSGSAGVHGAKRHPNARTMAISKTKSINSAVNSRIAAGLAAEDADAQEAMALVDEEGEDGGGGGGGPGGRVGKANRPSLQIRDHQAMHANRATSRLTGAARGGDDRRCCRTLNPRRDQGWMSRWDLYIFVLLIFTAFVTPYEVALLTTDVTSVLFVINRVVDGSFIVDMCFQLNLDYPLGDPRDGRWVTSRWLIFKRYLKSWLLIDIVSVFPIFIFEIEAEGGDSDVGRLKIMRTVRLMRLLKLARMLRASRIFRAWEAELLAYNFAVLSLVKFVVLIFLVGHWLACVWALVGIMQDRAVSWIGAHDMLDATPSELYVVSLHWSLMTLTSIGYGDIVPHTHTEYIVSSCCMLTAGCTWAYIIGNACRVFNSLDVHTMEFHNTIDQLNIFMSEYSFPAVLKQKLRNYFLESKHLQRHVTYGNLIEQMSPGLQGEVALACSQRWLKQVWYFHGCQDVWLAEIACRMRGAVFPPLEFITNDALYVIQRGVVMVDGLPKGTGKVWGEDIILDSAYLRKMETARSITFAMLTMLRRGDLDDIRAQFPEVGRAIRRAAVRTAVRRGMVRAARRLKARRELKEGRGKDGGGGTINLLRTLTEGTKPSGLDSAEIEQQQKDDMLDRILDRFDKGDDGSGSGGGGGGGGGGVGGSGSGSGGGPQKVVLQPLPGRSSSSAFRQGGDESKAGDSTGEELESTVGRRLEVHLGRIEGLLAEATRKLNDVAGAGKSRSGAPAQHQQQQEQDEDEDEQKVEGGASQAVAASVQSTTN